MAMHLIIELEFLNPLPAYVIVKIVIPPNINAPIRTLIGLHVAKTTKASAIHPLPPCHILNPLGSVY